jgi:VanZ family protein
MTRALVRALAPLALMGLIFFLSAQQADEGLAWWDVVLRKIGHVGGYALLTLLWTSALVGVTARPVKSAALIAFLYACTDEYHQSFVETRNGSAIDVGIDAIGIALATCLVSRRPLTRRRESTLPPAARASSSVHLSDRI